jgi:CoA:oxalate CoA-transferase
VIAPRRDRGMSGLYTWANLGKRNVCIDLRKPGGRELALGLVARSDAVLENFRPGVAERLGIGWEAVHAANARAVMVSISAGHDPRCDRAPSRPPCTRRRGLEYAARKSGPGALPADAHDSRRGAARRGGGVAALRQAEHGGRARGAAMYDAVLATFSETPLRAAGSGAGCRVLDAGPHG